MPIRTPTETPEYRERLDRIPQIKLSEPRIEGEYIVDCLGGRTSRGYLGMSPEEWARHSFGGILDAFAPSFSEDYYDWIDLLDAVPDRSAPFTMVELGAGYGRWLAHGGNLCVKVGRPLGLLVGCEAEPSHFRWMREHLRENGHPPECCRLHEAAVAETGGTLPFYVGVPANWYGQSIAANVLQHGSFRRPNIGRFLRRLLGKERPMDSVRLVRAVPLGDVVGELGVVDFMHVDIQGAEYDVLSAARHLVDAKVRSIHVGTHSPDVEATRGRDMDASIGNLFASLGWTPKFHVKPGESVALHGRTIKFVDGVQSWANPRLAGG